MSACCSPQPHHPPSHENGGRGDHCIILLPHAAALAVEIVCAFVCYICERCGITIYYDEMSGSMSTHLHAFTRPTNHKPKRKHIFSFGLCTISTITWIINLNLDNDTKCMFWRWYVPSHKSPTRRTLLLKQHQHQRKIRSLEHFVISDNLSSVFFSKNQERRVGWNKSTAIEMIELQEQWVWNIFVVDYWQTTPKHSNHSKFRVRCKTQRVGKH